jgi:hypothetical protein
VPQSEREGPEGTAEGDVGWVAVASTNAQQMTVSVGILAFFALSKTNNLRRINDWRLRGSNPCRGANTFLAQLQRSVLLTVASGRSFSRTPNIPNVVRLVVFCRVGREVPWMCKLNLHG